jgi:hypothetical protein
MALQLAQRRTTMTNTMKSMTKLAVAAGLIGGLALSAASPSLAATATEALAAKHQAPVHRAHSTNPRNDVYNNGRYVGSDPDPQVRSMLQSDPSEGY